MLGRLRFLAYMPNWRRRARLLIDWSTARLFRADVTELDLGRSQAVAKMRFSPGDEIVREGELGNYFYMVTDGEVEVVENSNGQGTVVRKIGPGGYFGEIALSRGIRRTASVRATKETSVLALHRRDFVTLSSTLPLLGSSAEQVSQPSEKA
jgi:CRP-like cAMP-binding protein